MFAGIEGVRLEYILDGIIFSIVFGFAAGNYACSMVFRLPRGRLLLDAKPYCGTCNTPLAVKDLFPVISAVMLRHKCRYCGTPFPVSHTWTELLIGLLAVLAFLQYNFSNEYVLLMVTGCFMVTLAAIEANDKMIMNNIIGCVAICGLIYRVLEDHGLHNSFYGGLMALIVGCLMRRKDIQQVGHIYVPPKAVFVAAAGGMCAGADGVTAYAILLTGFYYADWLLHKIRGKPGRPLITVSVGLAAMLMMLYPSLAKVHAWFS
ncbi:MAG: prepilin peptidase [Proteobacteria bacterium]|nr:prepilin peptidase [Pseudomonadota bacterium]